MPCSLSSGSLGGHGSLELSALGRARAHLHTYTHTLTRRGCTYIALLCNDGNFFSLTHTHPHTMHLSLSSLLPPTKNGSFLATRPIGPFHRHSLTLELLHWRSCLTQTRGGMAGARGSRKLSLGWRPMEVNSEEAGVWSGDRWLAMAAAAGIPGDGS